MTEDPPFAELFWGAYLTSIIEAGEVTSDSDIPAIKKSFMAGLRGETE